MQKVLIIFIVIYFIVSGFSGCNVSHEVSTADNAKPDNLYRSDNSIDMFVYNDTAYVNALESDWVTQTELTKGDCIGEIQATDIKENFEDFDATVLPVSTKIYLSDNNQILFADKDGMLIPYLKYVEG